MAHTIEKQYTFTSITLLQ